MNISANKFLEILKNEVLSTAGFKHITPSDCKVISSLVTNKTRQTISETTLKRIYGFAFSKFKPSLFTIDTLAIFCGYNGWADFCEKKDDLDQKIAQEDIDWHSLKNNVNKITSFTLQALKNKSGIPYSQTIKRKFIDDHFDTFLNSDHSVILLAAPAGYGKTIGLCHWVDEKVERSIDGTDEDIVLFFSSNALMSVLLSGRDINDWMLTLLGYSPDNDLDVLFDVKRRKKANFYLIVDGLDEHMFKNEHFKVLFNHLIDIFSFYKSHDWFKLVLTMRSSTWVNNHHEIGTGVNSWYTGFKPGDFCINVPLFSIHEIKELCIKINPSIQNFIAINVAKNFNHPLYFQFYYNQHKENFSFNNVDYLSIYELISVFILNKVYLGQYATEKMLVIEKLVQEMDIGNGVFTVDKLKINQFIKQYNNAYQELIGVGFLRELNDSNDHIFKTYIEFVDSNFLDHSIAKTLLNNNGELFNAGLVVKINELFINDTHKLAVLKWCVMHAIKTGQLNGFEYITEVKLGSIEKSELVIFLGDLLEKEHSSLKKNEALMNYLKKGFDDKIFEYFFGLELLSPGYKKTLQTLLKFELNESKKILIYSTLGIIALIRADLNELKEYLGKLKSFDRYNYRHFVVNPFECLDVLYYYLKTGIIKKGLMQKLTGLYFNPPDDEASLKHTSSNDLLYLLGLYTLMLCDNPKKTLRFINFLNTSYRNISIEDRTNHYRFFLKMVKADAYFNMGNQKSVSEIYFSISDTYKKSDNLLTPYMKTLFYSLKIKSLVNTNEEYSILDEAPIFNVLADLSEARISKLFVYKVILGSESLFNNFPDFYATVKNGFNKIVNESGLNPDILLQNIAYKE